MVQRIGVKVCGVCSPADAQVVSEAGADYLGVILSPSGPRQQTPELAAQIYAAAPALRRVGVFVDADPRAVLELAARLDLVVAQLHGDETPETAAALRDAGLEVWKAVRLSGGAGLADAAERYAGAADALLLDGYSPAAAGGAGGRFDWTQAAAVLDSLQPRPRIVAAGGLTPENVGEAVRALAPEVVDVSSGVESAVGRKNRQAVHAFVRAARGATVRSPRNEDA